MDDKMAFSDYNFSQMSFKIKAIKYEAFERILKSASVMQNGGNDSCYSHFIKIT